MYEVLVPPGASTPAPPVVTPAGPAEAAAAAAMGIPVKWTAPANWEPQTLSNLINKGYYKLPEVAGSKPELTISAFPGTAGGLAPNVNRWRRQLGQPELEAAALEKEIGSLEVSGQTLRVCEIAGKRPDGSDGFVLGAVLTLPGETWFFKLTGQAAALPGSKELFTNFLRGLEIGEAKPAATAPPAPPPAPGPSATVPTQPVKVGFVVPSGWEEQPASGMRDASFRVPGPGGKDADVSLLRLSGGTDAQNVNMWRQQLGLAALGDAEAAGALVKKPLGGREIRFYDQSGPGETGDRPRVLASIWDEGGTTWVARMRGGHVHLEQEKEKFLSLLGSLQIP